MAYKEESMAKKNYNYNKKNKKRYSRKARSNELKKFAYNMGLVERGLKNPDSVLSACYKRGETVREKSDTKKRSFF